MTGAFPAQDALKKRVFSAVAAPRAALAALPAESFVVAFFPHGVRVSQDEWPELSHNGALLAEEIRVTRERRIMPIESAFDDIAGLLKDFSADKARPADCRALQPRACPGRAPHGGEAPVHQSLEKTQAGKQLVARALKSLRARGSGRRVKA